MVFPQLQKILVVDPDGHTTVYSFNEIFKKTGVETLRELIMAVHDSSSGKKSAISDKLGAGKSSSSSDAAAAGGSEEERVFFLKIRHGETFKLREEYLDVGFVLIRDNMTLTDVRKLIVAAHRWMDDDDSDEDSDDEADQNLQFLADSKFSFGVKKVVEEETKYFKVPKKQEKQFLMKDLSDNDICVFETDKSASKQSSKETPAKSENKIAPELPGAISEEPASTKKAKKSRTMNNSLPNESGLLNIDDEDDIEAIDLGDFPWLKKNLVSENASDANAGDNPLASLFAAAKSSYTQNLSVDMCLGDEDLSRELRKHSLHELGVQEENVFFLQALKNLEKRLMKDHVEKMCMELKNEIAIIKDTYLNPDMPTKLDDCVYSDRRDFSKNPLMENMEARLVNMQMAIFKQHLEPELAGFIEAKEICESKLDACLKCLKQMHSEKTQNSAAGKKKQAKYDIVANNKYISEKYAKETQNERIQRLKLQPCKVVIVGGGIAGGVLASKLSAMPGLEVILVDMKEYCENTTGVLRMMVHPELLPKYLLKHTDYMGNNGRLVVGRCTKIEKDHVVVNNGERIIPFDYCMVTTGSTYTSYIKTDNTTGEFRVKQMNFIEKKLHDCEKILVIGGGVVGTELVGEFCEKFGYKEGLEKAKKKIIFVQSGDRFVSRLDEKLHEKAYAKFKEWGVEIHMNERVVGHDPIKNQYVCVSGKRIDFDPTKGREFWCTGYDLEFNQSILGDSILKSANSNLPTDQLDSDVSVLQNEDKSYKCLPTFQLSGSHPNIFLGGDCVGRNRHFNGERMAMMAAVHATAISTSFERIYKKFIPEGTSDADAITDGARKMAAASRDSAQYPHMMEFHPNDVNNNFCNGEENPGILQVVSMGREWSLVSCPFPAFRGMLNQTDEGKATGIELINDGSFKSHTLDSMMSNFLLPDGDKSSFGMYMGMLRDTTPKEEEKPVEKKEEPAATTSTEKAKTVDDNASETTGVPSKPASKEVPGNEVKA